MMIRINLLPNRTVKRRVPGQQVLVALAFGVIAAAVANYFWWNARAEVEAQNQAKIASTKSEISALEKIIGEVNQINTRKQEVEKKLDILNGLRKQRTGPVRMLDALATATPKKVWLQKFEEKSNAVKLTAVAMSHDDVSEFMRGLSSMVWTPKGMGRLIEQKREAKTSRVEMVADGAVEEFPVAQVGVFFTNIDLKKAEQKEGKTEFSSTNVKTVEFDLTLTTNYAI